MWSGLVGLVASGWSIFGNISVCIRLRMALVQIDLQSCSFRGLVQYSSANVEVLGGCGPMLLARATWDWPRSTVLTASLCARFLLSRVMMAVAA